MVNPQNHHHGGGLASNPLIFGLQPPHFGGERVKIPTLDRKRRWDGAELVPTDAPGCHLPPTAAPAPHPHWGWWLRGGCVMWGGLSPAAIPLSWLWDDGKQERCGWLLPSLSAPRPPHVGGPGPTGHQRGLGDPVSRSASRTHEPYPEAKRGRGRRGAAAEPQPHQAPAASLRAE